MVRTLKPTIAAVDMRTVKTAATEQRLRGRAGIAHRQSVLKEEPLCRACKAAGRVTLATVVDHITPLAKGGTNARSNLQPLCTPCHDAKTATDFAQR